VACKRGQQLGKAETTRGEAVFFAAPHTLQQAIYATSTHQANAARNMKHPHGG
jgi:hypothetical protein